MAQTAPVRPKGRPRRPKRTPGGVPEGPKTAQDGPKTAQEAPNMAQDGPKTAQEAPYTAPEGPERPPRSPKEPPRGSQTAPKRLQNCPQERGADERREAPRRRKRAVFDAPVAMALLRCASYFAATPLRLLRRGPRRRRVCPDPLPRPPRSWRESSNAALAWTLKFLPFAKLENLGIRCNASGAFGGEQHYSSF